VQRIAGRSGWVGILDPSRDRRDRSWQSQGRSSLSSATSVPTGPRHLLGRGRVGRCGGWLIDDLRRAAHRRGASARANLLLARFLRRTAAAAAQQRRRANGQRRRLVTPGRPPATPAESSTPHADGWSALVHGHVPFSQRRSAEHDVPSPQPQLGVDPARTSRCFDSGGLQHTVTRPARPVTPSCPLARSNRDDRDVRGSCAVRNRVRIRVTSASRTTRPAAAAQEADLIARSSARMRDLEVLAGAGAERRSSGPSRSRTVSSSSPRPSSRGKLRQVSRAGLNLRPRTRRYQRRRWSPRRRNVTTRRRSLPADQRETAQRSEQSCPGQLRC
jgi:hypothetical protein